MVNSHVVPAPFTWDRYRYELRKSIESSDIKEFKTWPTVNACIYTRDSPSAIDEIKQLKASDEWHRWRKIDVIPVNGTLVHQAYSLWKWETFTGRRVEDLTGIAEFGAGYGEMANLCFSLGFDGTYYIYDFPELIEIQRYYIGDDSRVVYCNNADDWKGGDADLLIALCSLSEAPIALRDKFLRSHQSHLVRYQDYFHDIDNTRYFSEFAQDLFAQDLNKQIIFRCEHYTPHWYLLSEAI